MVKSIDLLCVAGVCADLIFSPIAFIPKAGEEAYSENFAIKGGGGGNTPVAAAKLGLQTALLTKIGQDVMGDMLLDIFENSGLSTQGVLRDRNMMTACSAVMSLNGGERAFASYDKTDMASIDQTMVEEMVKNARHIHTFPGYCKALPLLEYAKKHGATVSLDTGYDPNQRLETLVPYLKEAHIFLPNEQEALQIAGTEDVESAAKRIGELVPVTVIKCGAKGALFHARGETQWVEGIKGVRAVDTTGAGDNFIAGFLYGYLKGMPLEECVQWGNASGALSVTFAGGMDADYKKEEVERLKTQYAR